ncbi:MAG: hypothetical protein P9M03_02815 [Candidatus Theseobacter exili]|nr:hypothetical protein [Candidatus Theseobacter exili]
MCRVDIKHCSGSFLIEAIIAMGMLGLMVVMVSKLHAFSIAATERNEAEYYGYTLAQECLMKDKNNPDPIEQTGNRMFWGREYVWKKSVYKRKTLNRIMVEVSWNIMGNKRRILLEGDIFHND